MRFAIVEATDPTVRLASGHVERVGRVDARLVCRDAGGRRLEDRAVEAPDHTRAAEIVIEHIERHVGFSTIVAVGHRVVHGGMAFVASEPITPAMLDELRRISPLDPDHLPGEIALIVAFKDAVPGVPHVACFDTSFHRMLPRVAQIVPIPRRYWLLGVRRYGFHGLSYAYLMEELNRIADPAEASGKVILAHLGSGASLAAVSEGRSVETTMGFTPASGLVMGTRSGDLDPGLVAFLAHAEGMDFDQFHHMVHHESGLLGVSETSADLRDLMARRESDVRAAEAVDLFCYRVKTAVGSLSAALGGLDSLVFSGGIGENSPEVRRQVCEGLGFLGIEIDHDRNAAGASMISTDASRTRARVIRTDEELMIARDVIRVGLARA